MFLLNPNAEKLPVIFKLLSKLKCFLYAKYKLQISVWLSVLLYECYLLANLWRPLTGIYRLLSILSLEFVLNDLLI